MTSAVRFIRHGSPLTRSWVPPTVLVDGRTCPVNTDDALIPVEPGVRMLAVSENMPAPSKWASMGVPVAPGQVVTVCFSPPAVPYTSGTLGFIRPDRAGTGRTPRTVDLRAGRRVSGDYSEAPSADAPGPGPTLRDSRVRMSRT